MNATIDLTQATNLDDYAGLTAALTVDDVTYTGTLAYGTGAYQNPKHLYLTDLTANGHRLGAQTWKRTGTAVEVTFPAVRALAAA